MSSPNHSRMSVMRDLDAAFEAISAAGLTPVDARTSLHTIIARLPVDPFQPSALRVYFGHLDWTLREVTTEERVQRLMSEFGTDAARAAQVLCQRFAIAPERVTA